ncbi:hypothetical protein GGQ72_004671 [Rhizobium rhizoryzae]|jgi:hypothetical protein|uniref:Uncharacterized protein n=1 Tax=Rhizobium rhizoryzae TaxID=451876 RepID=A0A7W6LL61_9HYPH|nr:hypothetical protein [Rhizobium rhizoryzae]
MDNPTVPVFWEITGTDAYGRGYEYATVGT